MSALSFSSEVLPIFFEERHRALSARLTPELLAPLARTHDGAESARLLGEPLGLYAHLVPEALGGAPAGRPGDATAIDVRALVLIREALGQVSPLADSIFAVQGLGSYPVVLAGSEAQRQEILPEVIRGSRICAFGLTEPEAGSDVASMRTVARREGEKWLLSGEKTLISNVPIAHHVVVFATVSPEAGRKGISAFLVEATAPGLTMEPVPLSVPHPLGRLRLDGCPGELLGEPGTGFRVAMETLDAFRISVGAAANGMASRALAEAVKHVRRRRQFGVALAEQQIVRAYLAEMATELDAARLLVARAAHQRDTATGRVTVEAAMAKMYATEAAQRIIDKAVQLHGGSGVTLETEVERLYREIRPLRIYEGTTEIQKLIIAKGVLDRAAAAGES
ncbi:acyl-CoA dehydrogenase family protein [Chondromyces apiculatus]|uniref:Butyryl-CoA dehydrogenase n=1 Tax=Chondromyces apiculatus DSM 436 TaxID=1192034 RepID=A0A017SUP6_9BACT|nr:acyl-CoA dehydrogenase family protein [Chondromyces apiculatus]EYF00335.1 Butyryl-CoA dehydrogenase [Chondromyces apiculatus DSM 436]